MHCHSARAKIDRIKAPSDQNFAVIQLSKVFFQAMSFARVSVGVCIAAATSFKRSNPAMPRKRRRMEKHFRLQARAPEK